MQPGDVLALSGRNHLDLHIPYYAALMIGMPIAGVDPEFKYSKYLVDRWKLDHQETDERHLNVAKMRMPKE